MAMVKVMVRQTCVNPVEPSYFLRLRQVVYLQAHWKNRQTTTRAPVLAVGERDSWECRVAMIPNQTIITLAEGACDALQPAANRQTDLWTRNLYSGVGMRRMGWWARAWVNKHGHWDGDGDGDGRMGMGMGEWVTTFSCFDAQYAIAVMVMNDYVANWRGIAKTAFWRYMSCRLQAARNRTSSQSQTGTRDAMTTRM